MSEGLSTTAVNALLDALGAAYPWIKPHVGAPGAAGTANAAVETTRKQAAWAPAAGANLTTSAQLQWTNVAASEDWTHFTAWSASSGGTFGFSGTVTASPVTATGTLTVNAGDLDASLAVAS